MARSRTGAPQAAVRRAAVLAVTAMAAGCGGAGEQDVRGAVRDYFDALARRDVGGACARLDSSLDPRVAAFARRRYPDLRPPDCPTVLERVLADSDPRALEALRGVRIAAVAVRDRAATVRLAGEQRLRLRRTDAGWRIARLSFAGAAAP